MTIRVSKDYILKMVMYESDVSRIRRGKHFTMPGGYEPEWETIEVTVEQLQDYISKGYAIKINC